MDTIKQFKDDLMGKINVRMSEGNVKEVNEIAANIMVGASMAVIMLLMFVSLALNEYGIFGAPKNQMRVAVLISLAIEAPICAINSKFRGEKKGLKYWLLGGILAMCIIMTTSLGHNVTMIIVFPVLLSVRYYDEQLTGKVALGTALAMILTGFLNTKYGIVNLNIVKVAPGTTLNVETNLREAVKAVDFTWAKYAKEYLIGDLLPRYIQFSVVAIACSQVAKRGRRLIEIQAEVANKTSRLETELNLATEIQASMLPCIFPAFPNHAQLDIFAKNIPAKEVGGDFYDYFQIDANHVALVMADVSGKGVGAALFMTVSKVIIKNQLQAGRSIGEAITNANAQLCENNDAGLFVTVWACVIETSTGIVRFVNAGHNPPIVCRKNGDCEYLTDKSGLVVAVLEEEVYKEHEIKLEKGDALLLYTDGVTEATDANNELYGEERLMEYAKRSTSLDAEDALNGLLEDVNKFVKDAPQFDDITILTMKVN